jgi:surfactin synthase thioesterase subunit
VENALNDVSRGIVFFPGAGSFGSEFQLLADALGPAAWVVRYPGRHGRDFGSPAKSFDAVALACAEQISGRTKTNPLLIGHSFGAYVAYATAARLQTQGIGVSALVVVGATAPGCLAVPEQATGTPAGTAAYLDSIDPSTLADAPSDDWREIVAEAALGDLRLLRQFEAGSRVRVRCRVLAARGDADPLTSDAGLGGWANHTNGEFSWRTFPGGHSDFLRTAACVSWVQGISNDLLANADRL